MSHVRHAKPDLIVVGGGAAGLGTATEAARHGLRVLLVDEGNTPSPPRARASLSLAPISLSSIDMRWGEAVWSVSGAFRVDTIGADGPHSYEAQRVVVATGPQARLIPFPGWTTPGVIGLAAPNALLKSPGAGLCLQPGQRVLVAGCGPLLMSVAVSVLDMGGVVAAVVDLACRREWVGGLWALAPRPAGLVRGLGWLARLRAAGVPVLHGTTVTEVASDAAGLHVAVGCVDGAGRALVRGPALSHERRRFRVDVVVVGHGQAPATDITRLMRAQHAYDTARGFWHPVVDGAGRSSVAGLYVAGAEGGDVGGRITGLAVARDMGRISAATHALLAAPLHRKAARAARFARATAEMMARRSGLAEAMPADTVVCRCEAVTRADIDTAVLAGATTLNQLKAWTRCGMGACQGRICADTAAALLAVHDIKPECAGQFTGRTPLRPLPLDLLTGDYSYADIILPPAAPP